MTGVLMSCLRGGDGNQTQKPPSHQESRPPIPRVAVTRDDAGISPAYPRDSMAR